MKHFLLLLSAVLLIVLAPVTPSRAAGEIPYELKNVCIYHPEPNYWAMARRGMHGKVVAQLKINPKTGIVDEVKLLHKTMYAQLNAEIVLTCFQWRFKPGTITECKVPFELITSGFYREVH